MAKFRAYASLASIGLGWKGLSGINTLAYYNHLSIVDVKSFITSGPDQSGDPHRHLETGQDHSGKAASSPSAVVEQSTHDPRV
jgi:hypothetical protein